LVHLQTFLIVDEYIISYDVVAHSPNPQVTGGIIVRKHWLFIPVTVGLVALFVTTGAIFAQGNNHPSRGVFTHGIVSRVAEILDLEESTVQSAFNQAIREHQDEHLQTRLDRLVEAERLTQEQADDILQWYQSRPDATIYLRGMLLRGEEALQRRLDRLVAAEIITQEEADEVLTWYQSRPEDLPSGIYGYGHRGHWFGHGPAWGDHGKNNMDFRGSPQSSSRPVAASTMLY
jgi:hypothetical protein